MAAPSLNMNWTGVSFSYGAGPTTIDITGVNDIKTDVDGKPVYYSGDAAPGPTAKKTVDRMRSVTLDGADIAKLASVPQGVVGTLTYVFNSLANGTGAGAITFTLINASVDKNQFSGAHNQIGKGSLTFTATWTDNNGDGTYTDPLSSVVAS
jgi:hypothetical protein